MNAHSLFSKWFSESGKMVQGMFARITELLEDGDALVCVLIDEVESRTGHCTVNAVGLPSFGRGVARAPLPHLPGQSAGAPAGVYVRLIIHGQSQLTGRKIKIYKRTRVLLLAKVVYFDF